MKDTENFWQNISIKIALKSLGSYMLLSSSTCPEYERWSITHVRHMSYCMWPLWIGPSNHQTQPIWGQQQPFLWCVQCTVYRRCPYVQCRRWCPISHVPHSASHHQFKLNLHPGNTSSTPLVRSGPGQPPSAEYPFILCQSQSLLPHFKHISSS